MKAVISKTVDSLYVNMDRQPKQSLTLLQHITFITHWCKRVI